MGSRLKGNGRPTYVDTRRLDASESKRMEILAKFTKLKEASKKACRAACLVCEHMEPSEEICSMQENSSCDVYKLIQLLKEFK